RAEAITVGGLGQVEHDRALAAVVLPEEQRALGILAVLIEGANPSRGVAAGRLHLDDVGAESRQRQPAVLSLLVRQLDDANAREGAASFVSGFHVALQSSPGRVRVRGVTARSANISRSDLVRRRTIPSLWKPPPGRIE